ncbi:MAG: hypothetical protein ICCCNLDF_00153 [Planctomycetes bacterium]|nr:hypothetical protein [Planctomycetota bacterium]
MGYPWKSLIVALEGETRMIYEYIALGLLLVGATAFVMLLGG